MNILVVQRFIQAIDEHFVVQCFRTDILQRFPFPQRFQCIESVPEGIVWLQISEKYTMRFVNYPLRIYHRDPMDDDAMMNKVLNPVKKALGLDDKDSDGKSGSGSCGPMSKISKGNSKQIKKCCHSAGSS